MMDAETRYRECLEELEAWHGQNPWRPDRQWPTEAAKHWHDGHITALASVAIRCRKALDPDHAAAIDETWRIGCQGSDAEWYHHTGHCGGCGLVADCCECDGECGCWNVHGPPPEPYESPWARDRRLRREAHEHLDKLLLWCDYVREHGGLPAGMTEQMEWARAHLKGEC